MSSGGASGRLEGRDTLLKKVGRPLAKLTPEVIDLIKVWRQKIPRVGWSEITRRLGSENGIKIRRDSLVESCRRRGRIGETVKGYIYADWCAPEKGWGGKNKRRRRRRFSGKVSTPSILTSKPVDKLIPVGNGKGMGNGFETMLSGPMISERVISLTIQSFSESFIVPKVGPEVLPKIEAEVEVQSQVMPKVVSPVTPPSVSPITPLVITSSTSGIPTYAPSDAVGPDPVAGAGAVPDETDDEKRQRIIELSRKMRAKKAKEAEAAKKPTTPPIVADRNREQELGQLVYQKQQMENPLAHLHMKIKMRPAVPGDEKVISEIQNLWARRKEGTQLSPNNKIFFLNLISPEEVLAYLESPGKLGWLIIRTNLQGTDPDVVGFLLAAAVGAGHVSDQLSPPVKEGLQWRNPGLATIFADPEHVHVEMVGTSPGFPRGGIFPLHSEELGKSNKGGPLTAMVVMSPWEDKAARAAYERLGFQIGADFSAKEYQGTSNFVSQLLVQRPLRSTE